LDLRRLVNFSGRDRPQCQLIEFPQAFQSLETLSISGMPEDSDPISNFVSNLTNLREFEWGDSCSGRIVWEKLTRLRTVHLSYDESDWAGVISMIRQLVNLEELDYDGGPVLSPGEFSQIVEIVRPREHVLTLACRCDPKILGNCDATLKLKLINRRRRGRF